MVGPLGRGRHCEVHRRLYPYHELASSADPNRIRSKLRARHDPGPSDFHWLCFVGDLLMDYFREHILTIVAFWPLAGMIVLMLFNKENKTLIRWWANFVMIVGFVLSIPLWIWFDRDTADQMQFVQNIPWIQTIGANYHVGIDGISLLLVMLTTLLGPLAVLSSWEAIHDRVKEYYVFMLMLQAGMLGVFVSLDFFLFYVFWEVMLVPMYFIIGVWGGPRKLYAAIKFFLYTLFGSVLLLLGILALYFIYPNLAAQHPEVAGRFGTGATFDVLAFQAVASYLPFTYQYWIFLAFFVGFAIKVPMFPFHTWLPDAHVEAPTAGSVVLAAVLLKMGTYGFLRFLLPLFPQATLQFAPLLSALAILGIIYGGIVSWAQPDVKRLVAMSSVSHLGLVTLGAFALTVPAVQGSLLQMVNHGISTGGLFLIVGVLYDRTHSRQLDDSGGVAALMPRLAPMALIVVLSSLALPGTNGFVGEFLILLGTFQTNPAYAALASSGVILSAVYLLWMYQRVMQGPVAVKERARMTDLTRREQWLFIPLIALIFWIGVYPSPLLRRSEASVRALVEQVTSHQSPVTSYRP